MSWCKVEKSVVVHISKSKSKSKSIFLIVFGKSETSYPPDGKGASWMLPVQSSKSHWLFGILVLARTWVPLTSVKALLLRGTYRHATIQTNFELMPSHKESALFHCKMCTLLPGTRLVPDWPVFSPDLSPTKNIWYIMKCEIPQKWLGNIEHLKSYSIWSKNETITDIAGLHSRYSDTTCTLIFTAFN